MPERLVAQVLGVLGADRAGSLEDPPVVEVAGPEPLRPVVRSALAGLVVRQVPLTPEVTEASIPVMLGAAAAAAAAAVTEVEVAALLQAKAAAAAALVVDQAWSPVQARRKPKGRVPPLETMAMLIMRTVRD